MSSDWIATGEDGERYDLDNLGTQKWLEGQPVGVESAVHRIREKAAVEFSQHRDREAKLLRDLADELTKTLQADLTAHALRHEKEHPFRLGPAKGRR